MTCNVAILGEAMYDNDYQGALEIEFMKQHKLEFIDTCEKQVLLQSNFRPESVHYAYLFQSVQFSCAFHMIVIENQRPVDFLSSSLELFTVLVVQVSMQPAKTRNDCDQVHCCLYPLRKSFNFLQNNIQFLEFFVFD